MDNEFRGFAGINWCYGVTKGPNENDYLLDLHNNLSKNFKEITWKDKIRSLENISNG